MKPDFTNLKIITYGEDEMLNRKLTQLKAKYNTLDDKIKIAIWAGALVLLFVLILIGVNPENDYAGLNE